MENRLIENAIFVSSTATPLPSQAVDAVPLFVDLDGTLIAGDTLRSAFFHLLLKRPWRFLPLLPQLIQGWPAFKYSISEIMVLPPAKLHWRTHVLEWLSSQQLKGRRLVLATAAPQTYAKAVFDHLGIFEAFLGSDEKRNIKGLRKVAAIREFTGNGDFDYMGDSWADMPVFAHARRCVVVSSSPAKIKSARKVGRVEVVLPG